MKHTVRIVLLVLFVSLEAPSAIAQAPDYSPTGFEISDALKLSYLIPEMGKSPFQADTDVKYILLKYEPKIEGSWLERVAEIRRHLQPKIKVGNAGDSTNGLLADDHEDRKILTSESPALQP